MSLRLALNDGHGRIKDGTQRPVSEAENLSRIIAGPEALVSTATADRREGGLDAPPPARLWFSAR
jgi:hypothetical protein